MVYQNIYGKDSFVFKRTLFLVLIGKDHLGNWIPQKDCFLRLTFLQPPITQVIFFNQGMLLLGSNHFSIFIIS